MTSDAAPNEGSHGAFGREGPLSEAAILAMVGAPASDDWKLTPTKHADEMPADAPLRAALTDPDIAILANAFDTFDADALTAQNTYKARTQWAIRFGLLATILAALTVIFSGQLRTLGFVQPFEAEIARSLLVGQYVAIMVSSLLLYRLSHNDLFGKWKTQRANAEHARMSLFRSILRTGPDSPEALVQKLAYARRYLWHSQLQYFQHRGGKHAAASAGRERRNTLMRRLSWIVGIAVVVFALYALVTWFVDLAALPGGVLVDRGLSSFESALAGVGLVAAGFLAVNQALEALHQDRTNAARYAKMAVQLRQLGGTWDDPSDAYLKAQEAARDGDATPAAIWVGRLVSTLEAEHRQWLETMDPDDDLALVAEVAQIKAARRRI